MKSALWQLAKKATVNQVRAAMAPAQRPSYRVTQVYLDRCVEKGLCKTVVLEPSRPRGKKRASPGRPDSRYYVPVVDREMAVRERIVEFLDGTLGSDVNSLEFARQEVLARLRTVKKKLAAEKGPTSSDRAKKKRGPRKSPSASA